MKTVSIYLLLLAGLLLAGCQGAAPLATETSTVTATPAAPASPLASASPTNPTEVDQPAPGLDTGYPVEQPVTGPSGPESDLWLAYPPAPGDAALQRGNFFLEAVRLTPVESKPGAFMLVVEGSLPTPCNQPRVEVSPPNPRNEIVVELYSLVDPGMMCAQVIQPFSGEVAELAGFPAGEYTVIVNEQKAGEITIP